MHKNVSSSIVYVFWVVVFVGTYVLLIHAFLVTGNARLETIIGLVTGIFFAPGSHEFATKLTKE